MPRKKKTKERPTTVQCPIHGHRHLLQLIPHPDRPDLVIARCGKRDVYQASANPEPRPVEPAGMPYSYSVPSLDSDTQGE